MIMKRNPVFAAVLFLIVALLAHSATPAGERDRGRITTEGEGEAEIQGQDVSQARSEALENALYNAFENALVEILPLDLSLTGRQDVLDQLGARLKRYLLQYRVLSEMPALQVFFVNVEATFSAPLIREDLVALGFAWTDEVEGEPVELFVRVDGVASVRSYQELVQMFQEMANVNAATPHEVFGTAMVLRLEYRRSLDDLVQALSEWHSEEFAFRVEQVSDREVSVSLVPMGDRPPGR
jgi:hypothetical protein